MKTTATHIDPAIQHIREILETVPDPEVPVLSVIDLGIVRNIETEGRCVEITVTPTYSGCPAIDMMKMHIRMALLQAGFQDIVINQTLSPAWTTDWISESGKQKLKAFGIAPPLPAQSVCTPDHFQREEAIQCPLCNSYRTRVVSQFGSTACKALYQCNDCGEPFDYFKCH
ncbi:1,2-phenylacetyl-CoA epoxidase subunit PaaD [Sediminibacterium soli]|uniref:1,2-phenylacetyl-CoA epoxidase subunit PaaD n=1 Tax=Sediminibacterium soli TaxID=2698829 RepID=UPI00137B7CE0|nr:1,2-phenylacetyl-CoA epoxidase subunit PaaD [Sediminibacterium soli]NCI45328.1 phenylacetate-CoA oxygenase subunit PaaJ [Sediminibacterium soli]